jgi:hypothetical protein
MHRKRKTEKIHYFFVKIKTIKTVGPGVLSLYSYFVRFMDNQLLSECAAVYLHSKMQ